MAVPRSQHSPTFGQFASSQTVCRLSRLDRLLQAAVGRAAGRRDLQPRAACARGTGAPRPPCMPPGLARERVTCSRSARRRSRASSLYRSAAAARRAGSGTRSASSSGRRPARARRPRRSVGDACVANASRSCSAPSSRASEVIRHASIPQGTIHSNGCRSLLTLIAKPWVVTPRLTWTPIEPILRPPASGRPDAGQPVDHAGLDARVARAPRSITRSMPPDVLVDVVAVGPQDHDRIADQLARAVVGDAPAAVGVAAPRSPAPGTTPRPSAARPASERRPRV